MVNVFVRMQRFPQPNIRYKNKTVMQNTKVSLCLRIFYAQMSTNSEDAFELSYLVNAVHHRCITGNTYKTNTTKLHAQMYWEEKIIRIFSIKIHTVHMEHACIF